MKMKGKVNNQLPKKTWFNFNSEISHYHACHLWAIHIIKPKSKNHEVDYYCLEVTQRCI